MQRTLLVCFALVAAVAALPDCGIEGRTCQNGGVCYLTTTAPAQPFQTSFNTPQCICQHPYAGRYCEYKIRECSDSPCGAGQCIPASCQPTSSPSSYEAVQYDCFRCVCPAGWGGSPFFTNGESNDNTKVWNAGGNCDFPMPHDDCTTGVKCLNGGNCTNVQTLTKNTFECTCPTGYVGGVGKNCSEILYSCTGGVNPEPCQNGGSCPGGALPQACNCINGYAGRRCDQARWCDTHTCLNGGSCQNNANSGFPDYSAQGQCNCVGEFWGDLCEKPKFCSTNPCQNGATCNPNGGNGGNTGTCDCSNVAFNGLYCNATKFCASSPCQNGATCVDDNNQNSSPRGGEGSCICDGRWYGPRCEKYPSGCHITDCANGYSCPCTDAASCASNQESNTCDCDIDEPGTTVMQYKSGVFADCGCNTTVVRKCPADDDQYARSPKWTNGNQVKVDPKAVDLVCMNGGTCAESADKTLCQCRKGFWGEKCENYDNPCLNNPCENGGRCMISDSQGIPQNDRFWGYMCNCRYPFYGLNCENRWNAVAETPEICASNKCQNGATCYKRMYGSEGGFHATDLFSNNDIEVEPYGCTCAPGFGGIYCETAIQQCDMDRYINPCLNDGYCTSVAAPYQDRDALAGVKCTCKCGFWGRRCEFGGGLSSFYKGVYPNLLDFCGNDGMCQNGAECVNGLSRREAYCLCQSGWRGKYCDIKQRSAATGVAPSLAVAAAAIAAVVAAFKF